MVVLGHISEAYNRAFCSGVRYSNACTLPSGILIHLFLSFRSRGSLPISFLRPCELK